MKRFLLDKSTFLLTIIFVVATALIFFMMALTFKHFEKQNDQSEWMTHSYETSLELEKLYSNVKDIEAERRNFLLKREEISREIVKGKIVEIEQQINHLRKETQDNAEQIKNLATLDKMISYKYRIVEQSFSGEVDFNDDLAVKRSLLAGENVMASIDNKIHEMMDNEKELLEARKGDFLFSQRSTPFYLYIISLFSLALIGFSFFKINKDLKSIKTTNHQLELNSEILKLAEIVGEYGIWSYNYKTKEYHFSENLYRLFGNDNINLANKNFDFINFVFEEDKNLVRLNLKKIENGTIVKPFNYRIKRKDGKIRNFQVFATEIQTENEDKIVLGTITDLTDEINYKNDLEDANKELTFYNESSKEAERIGEYGFWRWMTKNDQFLFSDNLYKIFGLEVDENNTDIEVFLNQIHPDDRVFTKKMFQRFADKERNIHTFTNRIIRKDDGALRYIQISNKLLEDEEIGDYYLFISQDITDEVLAKKSIEEKNRNLEASNKELQAFNYVASHDLQEPLRKIETFISRLYDKDFENLSDSGKKYFERIQFAADRMRKLIDDLLQFSRTTRSEKNYQTEDLNVIFAQAEESIQHLIHDKKAEIFKGNLPTLKIIPFQIQQLFSNLLSNSIKYSKQGVAPQIIIKAKLIAAKDERLIPKKSDQKYYKITFEDNGIGFEQEYAEKIFELFNRLHGKMEYEGTGIGLAICKKIVENHKGYIFAEGNPGRGSRFTIYLPENIS